VSRLLSRLRRRPSAAVQSARPLLAVDIDGVLSLFGFEAPRDSADFRFHLVGGAMHCFSIPAGERVRELANDFDIVWATGWEQEVEQLSRLLDLPEWPYLTFKGRARFGSADWKLSPLKKYARGRPLAWIDDNLDERCYEWARSRTEPTLLVEIESQLGLQDVHVDALVGWARSLAADSPVGD
jgi:hypothetical protein